MENEIGERKERWWGGYSVIGGLICTLVLYIMGIFLFRPSEPLALLPYLTGVFLGAIVGAVAYYLDLVRVGRIKK